MDKKLIKADAELLGRIFAAEAYGRLLCQSKAAGYKRLVEEKGGRQDGTSAL